MWKLRTFLTSYAQLSLKEVKYMTGLTREEVPVLHVNTTLPITIWCLVRCVKKLFYALDCNLLIWMKMLLLHLGGVWMLPVPEWHSSDGVYPISFSIFLFFEGKVKWYHWSNPLRDCAVQCLPASQGKRTNYTFFFSQIIGMLLTKHCSLCDKAMTSWGPC